MSEPKPGEVTALLDAWNNGEQQALDELAPLMRISKTSGVPSAGGGKTQKTMDDPGVARA